MGIGRVFFLGGGIAAGSGYILFDRIKLSIAIGWSLFYRVEIPMIIEDPLFL